MPKKPLWSIEELKIVASRYKTRSEFQRLSRGAYLSAWRQGVLDEICNHMERLAVKKGHWDYENCKAEAKKYESRTDFMRLSGSAYNRALANKWLDEICSHMVKTADGYHYMVYAIVNKRLNKAYIGITKQNFEQRAKAHKKGGSTRSSEISTLEDTEYRKLTNYIFTSEELKSVEAEWALKYEKDGFKILNDSRMYGRTGVSERKYTDEIIANEAKKYKRRVDFKIGSPNHYDAAVSQRILGRVCSHMRSIKPKDYWTFEKCLEEAIRSGDRDSFCKNHQSAYCAAKTNGWLNEIWEKAGLRSLMDMSWRRPSTRKEIWCRADEYYALWISNNKCGMWKMRTLTGINLDKLVKKFASGWEPCEDKEWYSWSQETKKLIMQEQRLV